jgi:hypothetical protein
MSETKLAQAEANAAALERMASEDRAAPASRTKTVVLPSGMTATIRKPGARGWYEALGELPALPTDDSGASTAAAETTFRQQLRQMAKEVIVATVDPKLTWDPTPNGDGAESIEDAMDALDFVALHRKIKDFCGIERLTEEIRNLLGTGER